jgi:hypothetical protein
VKHCMTSKCLLHFMLSAICLCFVDWHCIFMYLWNVVEHMFFICRVLHEQLIAIMFLSVSYFECEEEKTDIHENECDI